jgi:hypothetical protein
VELQLYTPYRVLTVGPPCSVPLRNRGSSLLRRRSHRNRLTVCLFGPCTIPSPHLLPLRLSSGGFEQLRPSLGLLHNLSSSLAVERLRRWPSLLAKVASPIVAPRGFGRPLGLSKARSSVAWNAASSATLRACERVRTSYICGVKREGKKKTCRRS